MSKVLSSASRFGSTPRPASSRSEPPEMRGWTERKLLAALLSISEAKAGRFLEASGGIEGLVGSSVWDFAVAGLDPASGVKLAAGVELAARLGRAGAPGRRPLSDLPATVRYLHLRYRVRDQEVFGAMFLDLRGRLLVEKEFFRGTAERVAVAPVEVLRLGLRVGASKILLFHTHLSGNPAPSGDDLLATRRFVEAAELVGLRVVDHLVIAGPETWSSIRGAMGI